jgi:hypothetical protein
MIALRRPGCTVRQENSIAESAVAASQCLWSVVQVGRAGLRRRRRGGTQIPRAFALWPAALIALFLGRHIHLAPIAALQHFAAGQHIQAGTGSEHLLLIAPRPE